MIPDRCLMLKSRTVGLFEHHGSSGIESDRSVSDASRTTFLVGALGFEPRASCTPCKRASRSAPRPVVNAGRL